MKMQNQTTLNIDDVSKELWEQNLIVLKEGRTPEYKTYEDLFEGYKSIKAVTFSSSPSFFDSISSSYQKADIILGLSTTDFKNGLEEIRNFKISKKIREKTFIDIDDSTRDKIVNKDLNVFYGNKGTLIHSKYYILYGENTTRVIYGSANMTNPAFNESIKQAEIIAYIDDDKILIQHLEKNFEHLKKQSSSFFIPKQVKYYKENHVARVLSNDEEEELMKEDLLELSDEFYSAITLNGLEDKELDIDEIRYITQIMKESSRKSNNKYIRKDINAIRDRIHLNKQDVMIRTTDRSKLVESRSKIMFEQSIDGNPIINYQANESDFASVISNYDYNIEDLKKGLNNIDSWLNTYKQSAKYTPPFGKKIMDIILAGFSSVFFKDYRERIAETETINQITKIPMFIILSGQAESGKSELLNYLNKLLGNTVAAFPYEKLIGNKKIDTVLGMPVVSGNRMPIMIDEANVSHFSKPGNKLSTFIKTTSNDIKTSAAIFFTTNTEDFSMPTETRRRSHIYSIENIFRKSDMRADYKAVLDEANNTLFKIFCTKMVQHLNDENLYIKINHATKDIDFLYLAKVVFKEMYDECQMAYPDYLSNELVDDYDANGKREWKMLFMTNTSQIDRDVYEGTDILIVHNYLFHPNQGVRDDNLLYYKEYLPDYCKYEAISNKLTLIIKEKEFFEWLEIDDPYVIKIEEKKRRKFLNIFG